MSDYLIHYGIKGMHWGVRRYQNADGSLTPKGKARLESYKKKELDRLDKRSKKVNEKYERKLSKDLSERKRAKFSYRYSVEKGQQKLEKLAVKKLTYDQMSSEKSAVRVDRGKAVALYLLNFYSLRTTTSYTGNKNYPIDKRYRFMNIPSKNDTLRRERIVRADLK